MINIINISPVLSTFVSNVIQKQTFLLEREGVEWPEIQQDTQKGHFRGANFWAKLCPKIRVPNCHFFPCFKQIWAKNVGTKRSFGHAFWKAKTAYFSHFEAKKGKGKEQKWWPKLVVFFLAQKCIFSAVLSIFWVERRQKARPWPYIYIYIYIQGVSLTLNPKCDALGSIFFRNLILSAVL